MSRTERTGGSFPTSPAVPQKVVRVHVVPLVPPLMRVEEALEKRPSWAYNGSTCRDQRGCVASYGHVSVQAYTSETRCPRVWIEFVTLRFRPVCSGARPRQLFLGSLFFHIFRLFVERCITTLLHKERTATPNLMYKGCWL